MSKKSRLISLLALVSIFGSVSSCSKIKNTSSSTSSSMNSSSGEVTPEECFEYTIDETTDEISLIDLKVDSVENLVIPDTIGGRKVVNTNKLTQSNKMCKVKSLYIGANVKIFANRGVQAYDVAANFTDNKNRSTFFSSLEKIEVSSENKYYFARGNCLFRKVSTPNTQLVLGCNNSVIPTDIANIHIYVMAFAYTKLKSIFIPANVVQIDDFAFLGNRELTTFVSESKNYKVVDGFLVEGNVLLAAPAVEYPVLPSDTNINVLGGACFYGNVVKKITIPSYYTEITSGYYNSWFTLSDLEEITFEAGSKIKVVYQSFIGCKNLKELVLPENTTAVTNLNECTNLKSVKFPNSFTSLNFQNAYYYFEGCTSLETLIFDSNNSNYKYENEALLMYNKNNPGWYLALCLSKKETYTIASTGTAIKIIYDSAFLPEFFTSKNLIIPGIFGYNSYSNGPFRNLKLDSVTFEEDNSSGASSVRLFYNCEINDVYIPKALASSPFNPECIVKNFHIAEGSVYKYEDGFFSKSGNSDKYILFNYFGDSDNIVIPSYIYTFNNNVFKGKKIKSVTMPSSLSMTTGSSNFSDCVELEQVIFNEPSNVYAIDSSSFNNCINLKQIEIPASVTSIYAQAFKNSGLENIDFKEGRTSTMNVESSAFEGCKNLKTLKLPIIYKFKGIAMFKDSAIETLELTYDSKVITVWEEQTNGYVFSGSNIQKIIFNGTLAQLKSYFSSKANFTNNVNSMSTRLKEIEVTDTSTIAGRKTYTTDDVIANW